METNLLKNYAELIVEVGINIKPKQEVVVVAELDQPDFVKLVVETAYKKGAKKVEVEWSHQPLTGVHINHRNDEVLTTVEDWEIEKLKHRRDVLPCMIYLLSEDPDGLNGINREKYALSHSARYKKIKPIRDEMDNKYQWCIAAVPGKKWAQKMFPDLNSDEAVEKLWQAILQTSRVYGNAKENWQNHNLELKKRCDFLNSLSIKSLHYKSANGTDLTVGMLEKAQFLGGGEHTLSGNFFNPNIPSEEVFITPDKLKADGVVYSSKPLCYRGELIDEFFIKFENGYAVDCGAKVNEPLLKTLINMDEGSHRLGECALVPFNSPINNTGLLFYNTLFDENAACHLALGEGFTNTIKNYDKYSLEELRQMGVNDSMIHEDFMIGTADLNITATTKDGKEIEIFKNGEWAF